MKFDELLRIVGKHSWFDLQAVVQLTGESRDTVRTQMHRWLQSGKVVPLRRGMYTFAEQYRRLEISTPELANRIYSPSYLSLQWCNVFQ